MSSATISPKHAAIKQYYEDRKAIAAQDVTHELAVREPFKALLANTTKSGGWTLVSEDKVEGLDRTVRPDGTLRDANTLPQSR